MTTTRHIRITVEGKSYDVTAEILDDDSTQAPHPFRRRSDYFPDDSTHAPHPFRRQSDLSPDNSANAHPQALRNSAEEAGNLLCPISGTVIAVHVQQGQSVKKGEAIVTLEAMKMNTPVLAPRDCVVSEIKTQTGATIEEGAVIAVLS